LGLPILAHKTTMYKELRKKAKKKVEAKKTFYVCTVVFSFTSLILIILSYAIPDITFWLMIPIPVFLMVLGVLYLSAFGWPWIAGNSEDWEEEEIEKEMLKLYRRRRNELPPLEDLSETEILELKELERIKKKWSGEEDYV